MRDLLGTTGRASFKHSVPSSSRMRLHVTESQIISNLVSWTQMTSTISRCPVKETFDLFGMWCGGTGASHPWMCSQLICSNHQQLVDSEPDISVYVYIFHFCVVLTCNNTSVRPTWAYKTPNAPQQCNRASPAKDITTYIKHYPANKELSLLSHTL